MGQNSEKEVNWNTLLNKWFHRFKETDGKDIIDWQGQIIGKIDDSHYVAQLYEWVMGSTSDIVVIDISDITAKYNDNCHYRFYESNEDMVYYYKYIYKYDNKHEQKYIPLDYNEREELKREGYNKIDKSLNINERIEGLLDVYRALFDRSFDDAITKGFYQQHPIFEEHIAMMNYDMLIRKPDLKNLIKEIVKIYGITNISIFNGYSYWHPEIIENKNYEILKGQKALDFIDKFSIKEFKK